MVSPELESAPVCRPEAPWSTIFWVDSDEQATIGEAESEKSQRSSHEAPVCLFDAG
jgi:hypothetical protein